LILVCDASVVVKWFDARCESEVAEARRILNAHRAGALRARVLDLTYYEFGNALTHKGWQRRDVTAQLDDLELVCGEGLPLTPGARALAAAYAVELELTFYDAAYAAVAQLLDAPLVSADRELLERAGAQPLGEVVKRLGRR